MCNSLYIGLNHLHSNSLKVYYCMTWLYRKFSSKVITSSIPTHSSSLVAFGTTKTIAPQNQNPTTPIELLVAPRSTEFNGTSCIRELLMLGLLWSIAPLAPKVIDNISGWLLWSHRSILKLMSCPWFRRGCLIALESGDLLRAIKVLRGLRIDQPWWKGSDRRDCWFLASNRFSAGAKG